MRSAGSAAPSRIAAVVAVGLAAVAAVGVAGRAVRAHATQTDLLSRLQGPSAEHWLGTDQLGRDVLARLLAGAAVTLSLALVVLVVNAVVGTMAGLVAGRAEGLVRSLVLTVADTALAVPGVAVALAVAAIDGPGAGGLVVALCLVGWTPFCRLAQQHVRVVMGEPYIEAARALGCSPQRVLVGHVLPNVASPLVGHAAARFGHTVISISALSFLGLGPQPPSAEWGAMVAGAQPYIERAPLATAAPAIAIGFTAVGALWAGRRLQARLGIDGDGPGRHRRRRRWAPRPARRPTGTASEVGSTAHLGP